MSLYLCETCGDREATSVTVIKATLVEDGMVTGETEFTVALCEECRKALKTGDMIADAINNPTWGRRKSANLN